MAETDALKDFDWNTVTKQGLFLKWEAGKAVTLRVLTTDPVVSNQVFVDDNTGEENVNTKFSFIVYNFTDKKAQILSATPNMARKIGELHVDPDFGADIKKIDIKITPTGEKLKRRYDIQVLPKANELTVEQIKECAAIKLDEKVEGDRMSLYDPAKYEPTQSVKEALKQEHTPGVADAVADVPDDEPINLDDIPF